jgi:hypothetical protein
MGSLPEFVAVNPITLECPRCKVQEGHTCETNASDPEPVHIERIAAALKIDATAKRARARMSCEPSE